MLECNTNESDNHQEPYECCDALFARTLSRIQMLAEYMKHDSGCFLGSPPRSLLVNIVTYVLPGQRRIHQRSEHERNVRGTCSCSILQHQNECSLIQVSLSYLITKYDKTRASTTMLIQLQHPQLSVVLGELSYIDAYVEMQDTKGEQRLSPESLISRFEVEKLLNQGLYRATYNQASCPMQVL